MYYTSMASYSKTSDIQTYEKLRGKFIARFSSDEGSDKETISYNKGKKRKRKEIGEDSISNKIKKRKRNVKSSILIPKNKSKSKPKNIKEYSKNESDSASNCFSSSGYLSSLLSDIEEKTEENFENERNMLSGKYNEYLDNTSDEPSKVISTKPKETNEISYSLEGYEDKSSSDDIEEMGDEIKENEEEWTPCIAPDQEEIIQNLGYAYSKDNCFGCNNGRIDQPCTSYEKWNEMINLFKEGLGYATPSSLAKQMETFFEEKIRIPANKRRRKGQKPIPKWNAATILAHFTEHMNEPSCVVWKRLGQVTRMVDSLYKYGMWEGSRSNTMAKRPRLQKSKGEHDVIKTYKELVVLEKQLYNAKTKKMFLSNPALNINYEFNKAWINTNRPMYVRKVNSDIIKSRRK